MTTKRDVFILLNFFIFYFNRINNNNNNNNNNNKLFKFNDFISYLNNDNFEILQYK